MTQSEQFAVVTNRTDGVVSVVRLQPGKDLVRLVSDLPHTDIPFHPLNESKPWAAVIGADDDTAYVLLRGSSEVVRIAPLSGNPQVTGHVKVGSEPTSIVIAPSGKTLYVANWADGSVTSIITEGLTAARWDLNRRLAETGLLGPLFTSQQPGSPASAVWDEGDFELRRPGLAHPRALAITDSGKQDADETLYATEFFSQPLQNGGPAGPDDLDHSRVGLVYPIDVSTGRGPADANAQETAPIQIAAVDDVGFVDSEGNRTGCFPNQLYSAAAAGDRLYVTSVCASPSGPVEPGPDGPAKNNNFQTLMHTALFAVDTTTNLEIPGERLILTQALDRIYTSDSGLERRMPLIPDEVVVAPPDRDGTRRAYLSAFGSSAVFSLRVGVDGVANVDSAGGTFIDLSGSSPTGVAILSGGRALVADDLQPGLGVIDLAEKRRVVSPPTLSKDWSSDPSEVVSESVRLGRRLFSTGLSAWSFQSQGLSSCESCHPEGLSDGVTWRFARGPRRTISLAGTYYGDAPTRRMLLWGANIDEVHDVEGIARTLSGGVGGVVWNPYATIPSKDCRLLYDGVHVDGSGATGGACSGPLSTAYRQNGLNGSLSGITRQSLTDQPCMQGDAVCNTNASFDWSNIDAFIRTVQAPHAPSTLDPALVTKGQQAFEKRRCSACHAGPGWTLSSVFYEPGPAVTGQVPWTDPRKLVPPVAVSAAEISAMLGTLRTTKYKVGSTTAPSAFLPAGGVFEDWFRTAPAADATPDVQLDYVFGTGTPAPPADQIKCVLRSVGTFPSQAAGENQLGVVPQAGQAPPIHEVRRVLSADKTAYENKLALGATGFNIPSLLGVAASAPYFHAGNARSLEELFDSEFAGHYGVFGAGAPSAEEIQALVSYLLAIDDTATSSCQSSGAAALLCLSPPQVPQDLGFDPDLCKLPRVASN